MFLANRDCTRPFINQSGFLLTLIDAKELLDSACGVIFGAHPSQISLLFYLYYCKCAGGAEPLLESGEGSAQEWRIKVL